MDEDRGVGYQEKDSGSTDLHRRQAYRLPLTKEGSTDEFDILVSSLIDDQILLLESDLKA